MTKYSDLNPGITAGEVLDRIKTTVNVTSDGKLAKYLDITRSTLSSWRVRNKIPYELCVHLAMEGYASLDWLLRGVDNEKISTGLHGSQIDYELLAIIILQQKNTVNLKTEDPWEQAIMTAKMLVINYEKYKTMLKEETERHGVDRDVFLNHLKKVIIAFSETDDE